MRAYPRRIHMLLYAMAQSLSHLMVPAVFSTKDRRALLRSEEIRSETSSYMAGIVTDPGPPFQGDSSRGRLPRAEAHGLFCFRPSGDPK